MFFPVRIFGNFVPGLFRIRFLGLFRPKCSAWDTVCLNVDDYFQNKVSNLEKIPTKSCEKLKKQLEEDEIKLNDQSQLQLFGLFKFEMEDQLLKDLYRIY